MRRPTATAAVLALLAAASAHAADGIDLSMKSRAVASAASTRPGPAPFAAGRDPWPELLLREEQARRGPRGNCEYTTADLCYDLVASRVVYRPARRYMPELGGLTPEGVSVRSHRIVFRYSFR